MENDNLAYKYEDTFIIEETRSQSPRENLLPQKIYGVCNIIMGILLPMLCDGDASGSLLLIPLGVVLLTEKSKVM